MPKTPVEKHPNEREVTLRQAKKLARAALFAALTATGGLLAIQVPVSTVPFTLQTMFTLMAGLLLGSSAGVFSQFVYVAMGVIGLPVFARGSAGLGVLLGPTGGYLVGFILGAGVAGLLAGAVRKAYTTTGWARGAGYVVAALAGLLVIYTVGTLRLAAVLHTDLAKAVAVGVVPFVGPDVVKAIAAALMVVALERRGFGSS